MNRATKWIFFPLIKSRRAHFFPFLFTVLFAHLSGTTTCPMRILLSLSFSSFSFGFYVKCHKIKINNRIKLENIRRHFSSFLSNKTLMLCVMCMCVGFVCLCSLNRNSLLWKFISSLAFISNAFWNLCDDFYLIRFTNSVAELKVARADNTPQKQNRNSFLPDQFPFRIFNASSQGNRHKTDLRNENNEKKCFFVWIEICFNVIVNAHAATENERKENKTLW